MISARSSIITLLTVLLLIRIRLVFGDVTSAAAAAPAASSSTNNIDDELSIIRDQYDGLSLMGFQVNDKNQFCALGSDGYRTAGSNDPVNARARWHVGSCTKSMTATLIAIMLVENKTPTMTWSTPLVDILPEASDTPYERVSLEQLLSMQSCIPANPTRGWWYYASDAKKNLTVQRRDAAMDALVSTPTNIPGTAYCYSNWAYVVAGHILERTTGRLWEDLVIEKLFRPLGMTSLQRNTTFGIPRGSNDARGHIGVSPLIPCDCDNPAVLGPAGTFSGPTAAMALYLSWHVSCHNGNHNNVLLSQQACRKLHTPVNPQVSEYALGWVCINREWAGNELACTHAGSNTHWYYNMWIAPGINRAMVGATNTARDYYGDVEYDFAMTDDVIGSLIQSTNSDCSDAIDILPKKPPVLCFPGTATVTVKDQGQVMMRDLVVGDWVLVDDSGIYEPIYDFGHWNVDLEDVEYLQIFLENGQSLDLSADHMVFAKQKKFVPASIVTVGDVLSSSVEGSKKVRDIRPVVRQGAIAPFTSSGTIVVDGILASCYVAFQASTYLVLGGDASGSLPNKNNSMTPPSRLLPRTVMTTAITHQWLAHTFSFPHRFYCSHVALCGLGEKHVRDANHGLSGWTIHSLGFAQWLFRQNNSNSYTIVFFLLCVIPLLTLLLLLACLEACVKLLFFWTCSFIHFPVLLDRGVVGSSWMSS